MLFRSNVIKTLEANFFGGLIESNTKPLILYPIINIQQNLRKFKKISYREQGYNILENLFEITIYIDGKKMILINELIHLIKSLKYSSILKINLYILNFSENKTDIKEFILCLNALDLHCLIVLKINCTNYFDFISEMHFLKEVNNYFIEVIIENVNFEPKIFNENRIKFIFKIKNEIEYNEYNTIVLDKKIDCNFELDISKCELNFLEKFVFLDKTDILEMKITKRNYDANKVLNKNLFGKLIIKNNFIYNAEEKGRNIATLKNRIDIKELIFDALVNSNQWFLTRNKVQPCKSCIFRNICPPISEYEIKIKKYNFCNLN